MKLPPGFIDQMRRLLPDEADDFLDAMRQPPVTSVRLNRRKPGATFPDSVPVAWCRCGIYLPARPVFTLDPMLHAGAYYVQDASSMIYHEVVCRLAERLSAIAPGDRLSLLDLCAAPGGKTTAMIDALPDGSDVVANEYVAKRAGILRENIAKWGYPRVTVTNHDSSRFAANGDLFDIVAVDAPCSGEGMMRKEKAAVEQWSRQLVMDCARLQKEILANAVKTVRPGGFLIYSTCTFNREENEENAAFICSELGLEPVDMQFPQEWGIPGGIGTALPVYRFMPHKTKGEGLFLSVFRKPGEWTPSVKKDIPASSVRKTPARDLKGNSNRRSGKESPKRNVETVPEIEQILSLDFDRTLYPEAELSEAQALAYLRRESVVLPPDFPKGYAVVTFRGLPLGMVKNIGSRANNLYPKAWRILMQ